MELGVLDRLVLLNVLPKESDITTLRIVRDLSSALSFSEEELQTINFTIDNGVVKSFERDIPKEIPIGPKALALLSEQFSALDAKKKIPAHALQTYEKVLEEGAR